MAEQAILLNDFFRSFAKKRKLGVFLCGSKPGDRLSDVRLQVKRILQTRMNCTAFLGEEIEDIRKSTKVYRDHLTIEVGEARKSDLVLMFLGSPGTIAEVTAFAMDPDTTRKLLVFNDVRYKDAKSFVNFGPLRLLDDEQVVYYDPKPRRPSDKLVERIDAAVARIWYDKSRTSDQFSFDMGFEAFATLATVYASFPVRYKDLVELLPIGEATVRESLAKLFQVGLVEDVENKYLPTEPLAVLRLGSVSNDIARVRATLMATRLRDAENVSDYRLIF